MATRRASETKGVASRGRPATTPEERENQLIASAVDLAERQLQDGTASAQVISHYLKLGSSRERLEQERLRADVELAKTKIQAIESAGRVEELMKDAISAFRGYSGQEPLQMDGGEEDPDFL